MKTLLYLFFSMLLLQSLHAQVPTNGLVAEYLFTDGSYDDTNPNNYGPNHATAPSTVVNTPDRFGNPNGAKDLAGIHYQDPAGTYIELGTSADLKPSVGTISIWVKFDHISTSGWGYPYMPIILASNTRAPGTYMEAYCLYISISNKKLLSILTQPSPIIERYHFGAVVPEDSWHHYSLVYDNNVIKTYVDGVLAHTQYKGFNSQGTFSNESVRVGSSMNLSNNRALDGAVDDIRIYNRVLSDAEVRSLYQEAGPKKQYVQLKDVLDANYLQQMDDVLRFKFQQRYATPNNQAKAVGYVIYDWQRNKAQVGNFDVEYGINWSEIELTGLTDNTFYTLEITANKGEHYLLRFKTKQP